MRKPILFSFFSGAGFLDLGFELEKFHIAFVNEFHESFLKAYKYSRKNLHINEPTYGYSTASIENFAQGKNKRHLAELLRDARVNGNLIGFIGGPPCPDFSVGGKNQGRHGENGRLSQVYVEIIKQQKPDFFIFENVKGLWQTQKHRAFYEELKAKLQNSGYYTTERLINAIEYGAPQDRQRIILFGIINKLAKDIKIEGLNGNKNLPDSTFPWLKSACFPNQSAFSFPWPTHEPFADGARRLCPKNVPVELTVEHWFRQNDVENHPNSIHFFKPKAGLIRFLSVDEGDDSRKSFKRLHRWRYSPTACYGNNEVHLHPYKPRRISVSEALAIQSLPKNFSLPPDMTLTDMFKTVGNGVPYQAAKALARSVSHFLGFPK